MLDFHLAKLYGVETRVLIQAVKRNIKRFPDDFMFQLTWDEVEDLRSQIVILRQKGKHIRHLPHAFTEHGTVMLAGVLNSPIAIDTSIHIVRAFMRLRKMLASHKELARKIKTLEGKYDEQFKIVFDAIRALMKPTVEPKRRIGFKKRGG